MRNGVPARLPLSSCPEFVALPPNPLDVTAEQRRLAFPGLETACAQLGRSFLTQQSQPITAQEATTHARKVG